MTIFGTRLGLAPVVLAYRPSIQKFLDSFLMSEEAPLASLVFSEPASMVCFPVVLSGSCMTMLITALANGLELGAPGLQTTACGEGDEWVLKDIPQAGTLRRRSELRGVSMRRLRRRCKGYLSSGPHHNFAGNSGRCPEERTGLLPDPQACRDGGTQCHLRVHTMVGLVFPLHHE